jgi:hypothetical protein
MLTRHHALVSALVGVVLAVAVPTPLPGPLLVAGVTALGTLVDLDHFLIARVRTGSWGPLRRCLSDPRMALFDQDEIFDEGDVGAGTRLVSHVLVTGLLVGGLAFVAPSLALVAGVVLVAHVACDVIWDARYG